MSISLSLPTGEAARYFFLGPLPTVRLTFAPCLSVFPGFGFCASTWFLRALLEGRRMTMPGLQWAWAILTTALPSSIPTTFGTTHLVRGVLVAIEKVCETEGAAL